jgi:hypothetical protein
MNTPTGEGVKILGAASLALFLAALAALPLIIRSLPRDIFISPIRTRDGRPLVRLVILVLRNGAGLLLLLMGFIMLFIPGQGILTMLSGLVLMRFPGKTFLVHRLLSYSPVQKGLNLIRRRVGRDPFLFPDRGKSPGDID